MTVELILTPTVTASISLSFFLSLPLSPSLSLCPACNQLANNPSHKAKPLLSFYLRCLLYPISSHPRHEAKHANKQTTAKKEKKRKQTPFFSSLHNTVSSIPTTKSVL
jgi:hypothetical protein